MPMKPFALHIFKRRHNRGNGLILSSRLPNKAQLRQRFQNHVRYRPEQLPPKVDLRQDMTPVEDQGDTGSCVANALAGAYEYLTKKANGKITDVSRLFIYYNARVKDEKSHNVTDIGCTMASAIEALEEFGTCLESLWPYEISRVDERPSDQAYESATRHKITEAFKLNVNLNEMKDCLAQGFPFAFGLKLYKSFDEAGETAFVPMPNPRDIAREKHGSHVMLAVGYDDQTKSFIVRNSWGERWGDHGYCYIPYSYMANSKFCFDVWTVKKLATINFSVPPMNRNSVVNRGRPDKNTGFHSRVNHHSQIIGADGDYHGHNTHNRHDPWNQYRTYRGLGGHRSRHHYHHHHQQQQYPHQYHDGFKRHRHHRNFYYNQSHHSDNFWKYHPEVPYY